MRRAEETLAGATARLVAGETLAAADMEDAVEAIMSGEAAVGGTAAFLLALRAKGESEEEICGTALALRRRMRAVPVDGLGCVDTCGTGGDGLATINVSTAAAFVVAGAGRPVAKHGNRSASSRCGSADVAEALGVPLLREPDELARCLREHRLAFLYAPHLHPAMRHAAAARREVGVRTVFNLAGPLANPARVSHQVLGVPEAALQPLMARVLQRLGCRGAWLVTGADGMDELTTTGVNRVTVLAHGTVKQITVDGTDVGLERARPADLRGGDAAENARRIRDVLTGKRGPDRDIVVLNAAAALSACDPRQELAASVRRAAAAIDSGAAAGVLAAVQGVGDAP